MTTSTTDGCSTRDRRLRLLGVALLLLAACSSGKDEQTATPAMETPTSVAESTTTTAPTTTAAPAIAWPALPSDGVARALLTPAGIVVPVTAANPDGTFDVDTPCSNHVTATGTPIAGANVVLDPGHGGNEPGAVGPSGLVEKDVNLTIAEDVAQQLQAQGASVVLTRTRDYNTTIRTRAAIAVGLRAQVFVSIHHNAEPDGPSDVPGSETYYQIASPDSKRLAGLLWEDITSAFTPFQATWVADTDHGAKYRPSASGGDYYGILRNAAGVTTVLSEAAFISNPSEEQLLADPAFLHAEAEAIARSIIRFVMTDDPGSGFVTPYPRIAPAGGGGGPEGCVDPPL